MPDTSRHPSLQTDSEPTSERGDGVRRRGMVRLLIGVSGLLVVVAVHWLSTWEGDKYTFIFLIPAMFGALALLGVIEAITGIPYQQLARRWDSLKGWQRGVYGTGIVLVATVFIFLVIVGVVIPLWYPS